MRKLLAAGALLALVLAACSSPPGTSATAAPTASLPMVTPSEAASSSATAVSCSQAFTDLSATAIANIASLTGAGDQLDNTIRVCNTLNDWKAQAQSVLPNLDLSAAETFIKERCQASSTLSGSQLCTSLGA